MANPKSKARRYIFAVLFLLIAGGGGAGYYSYRKREQPIVVQTERAARRNLTEVVVANGKIQPVIQVKISPEVSGEITDLPVKEGQLIKKGELILKIKPDFYVANRSSADANFKACLANQSLSAANCRKAEIEFKRSQQLVSEKLISDSQFVEARTAFEVAQAQVKNAEHQADVAKAALARADEELSKTTIVSPLDGTVTKLNSQLGERVVGTATMAGTEVMTISDLNEMEARVDLGEVDVVLIAPGQITRLEVDAFRDRKFSGEVTEIANTAKVNAQGTQQEATKFEVRIRVKEKEIFRPGMSVTAEIETRYRTNVLCVPIQSVTTRLSKEAKDEKDAAKKEKEKDNNQPEPPKKTTTKKETVNKPAEVVFVADGDKAKMVKVTRGISDDNFTEITDGLAEKAEVISGTYKAINRELEDAKLIKVDNTKKNPGGAADKK